MWMTSSDEGQAATFSWVVSSSGFVIVRDPDPVLELGAGEDVRDEVVTVERPPALLGGVEQLVGHRQRGLFEPAPLVTWVRSLPVAKLPSIALLVRRCRQCSAGRS